MSRIFYGWFVLIALFATYAISNGISNYTLPLLYPSLMQEFAWNEAQVTRPATLMFFAAAFYSIVVGFLIDRFSARLMMIAGAFIVIIDLIAYTFVSELWQMTVVYLIFAFGLALCGMMPVMVVASRWFTKFRGFAVGILLMASSFGGAVLPLTIASAVQLSDWRAALWILIIIASVFMVLPLVWPLRDRPEDVCTTPDGLPPGSDELTDTKEHHGIAAGVTISQAMKMPIFYLLMVATGTLWFCITGILNHQSIYLNQQGLEGADLAVAFSVFFWCSIIGKVLFGWLSDKFAKGRIMLLAIINITAGLVILRQIDDSTMSMIYLYALVYGIGFAGTFTMVQLMIIELFAGPTYGRILGVFFFVDTLAAGAGIGITGIIRVRAGSYLPAIDLMIGMCVVALICVIAINRIAMQPRKLFSV
ncbi:MAG: MFS transporter [Rhodospirillaceae bacterium]